MRLIDADRLRKIFEDGECPCKLQYTLLGIVDVQPTAFDVDKVINELKRENLWKKIRAMEVFIFRKFLYARIFYRNRKCGDAFLFRGMGYRTFQSGWSRSG